LSIVAIIILITAIYSCNTGNRFHFHIPSCYFLCKTCTKNAQVPTSSQRGVSQVLNIFKIYKISNMHSRPSIHTIKFMNFDRRF